MKRIALPILISMSLTCLGQDPVLVKDSFYTLSPVEVKAIRAADNMPFTKTNLDKSQISKLNLGQDIPFLLNQTPSVVINSDAGNGIGYTGIRIRGTDATRINVTLNGIPYNDAESQGTFFVDLPDFTSSINSIQIQRGVGTSSNGAGAFGGTINFSTNEVNKSAYAEFNNSYGSFDSWKNTIRAGSGLINDHFTTDIRLSNISSSGFIDRATSSLKSFYFSGAYIGETGSIRLNIFSGKEKTYQAWYGISESDLLSNNRTVNYAGTEKPGTPYDNETDNFQQDHYQLFFDKKISDNFHLNTAVFLTKGKGYYEQYKTDESFLDYGINNPVNTDLVRQLWLDNDFYGTTFSLQGKRKNKELVLGGSLTRYDGSHFGELIWASAGLPDPRVRWYDLNADKNDLAVYVKYQDQLFNRFKIFGDVQYRHVSYDIFGFRNNPSLIVSNKYNFLNPKLGISYHHQNWRGYLSYSIANKEPNRDDFEAGTNQQPKPEKLYDLELGVEQTNSKLSWGVTLFHMHYKDQLILTGKINDVGAYTRTNIPKSYRAGIELQSKMQLTNWFQTDINLAVSRNKVKNFSEFIDDYDNGGQKTNNYTNTDIAYSPNVVGSGTFTFKPISGLEFSLLSKYVGDQFLDNTGNKDRKLDAFFTQDARIIFTFKTKWLKEINLIGQLNNAFDEKYEPNGYTFSYIFGGEQVTENYYFPMAGRNFMIGVNIKL